MRYFFLTIAICGILTFSTVRSETEVRYVGVDADIAAIDEIRTQFQERVSNGDIASAMTLMTDDAIYLQPGTEAVTGNSAIQALWEGTTKFMVVAIDYRVTELEVGQDLAFLIGEVSFRGTPRNGGDTVSDESRYIWILRRGDSGWKIARYMRNR
jgi:ketosteroid isomerase-like protein